jgi:hypothetical protein
LALEKRVPRIPAVAEHRPAIDALGVLGSEQERLILAVVERLLPFGFRHWRHLFMPGCAA